MAEKVKVFFTVTFDANGGESAPGAMATSGFILEDANYCYLSLTVPSGRPTRSGYRFGGWATSRHATESQYVAGDSISHTFSRSDPTSYTLALYAVWLTANVTITFDANGGSGGPTTATVVKNVSSQIPSSVPTRTGYSFQRWKYTLVDGTEKYCSAGGYVTLSADAVFIAQWKKKGSEFNQFPGSAIMDGSTQYTITLTKSALAHHHTIKIKLGNREQEQTNVDSSYTFTIPLAWCNALPNRTFYDGIVYLTTYDSSGNQIGDVVERSIQLNVPSSVIPTLSVTTSPSGNSTVASWGVYIEGYSSVSFGISASGVYSSTIKSIEIAGGDYSYSASYDSASISTTVASGVMQTSGDVKFIIKVVDSRGRAYAVARTVNVMPYFKPTLSMNNYRSDSQGVEDEFEGTYITTVVESVSITDPSHNTYTINLKRKVYNASSWTTLQDNAQLNTNYIFAAGISGTYLVYAKITDALGNYTEQQFMINSVAGCFSIGLNNDRARFGGAVKQQGLEVDWYSRFHDNVVIDGSLIANATFQTGIESPASVSSGGSRTVNITFENEFPSVPKVVACLYSSQTTGIGDCSVSVWSLSTTGFSLRLENNYSSAREIGATWIAMI